MSINKKNDGDTNRNWFLDPKNYKKILEHFEYGDVIIGPVDTTEEEMEATRKYVAAQHKKRTAIPEVACA